MIVSKTTAPFLALLLVSSAYAIENVKVTGEAKYWYQTTVKDISGQPSGKFFQRESSVGVAAAELGVSADLLEGLKGKVSVMALDSLGLEKSFVKDISSAGAGVEDNGYYRTQVWITEANLDYKIGNTSAIVGRQALNTPLLFTERWNASYNTFDAAVLMNSDIPYTTLVAAYVHQHNGGASAGNATATNFPSTTMHNGSYYGFGSTYNSTTKEVTDEKNRAYAFGAIVKPVKDLAMNLWYYDINSMFNAYWIDAEYKISGMFFGIQNSGIDVATAGVDNAMVTAAKVGYTLDKLTLDVAYSTTATGNTGTAIITNAATGDKSKVYTQSVFQDGAVVGSRDTDVWRAGAAYQFDGFKISTSYQDVRQATKDGTEVDIIATAKVAQYVNLTGMYIHQDVDEKTATDFKNDAFRLIASVKF
ncbi:MAG: hypothetical protein PHI38_06385 [Sulfurimonas sp.]|jgi:hypothetical protein|uniref:hypothetical protein n=1 Tax=Sulfurimonas sp. TaxID=2022749 RepID=UPI00261E47C3|nr:hypothetical protein [Sulfurimonas sp.]MDD3476477.1 hypothetical protein [Sulfurimonas sp.]